MEIEQIRRINARALAKQAGGQSRFGEKLDMARQQVSNIIGKTPVKNIGSELARRIELAFEKPHAWMDEDHSTVREYSDMVSVPLLDFEPSAGRGAAWPDSEDPVRQMLLPKAWIKQHLPATAYEHLALMTARGDSMEPSITDGSTLLVDKGVPEIKSDGVYVLAHDSDMLVKRVQIIPGGGLIIKSDNPAYDSITVSNPHKAGLVVLGRVLMTWASRRL